MSLVIQWTILLRYKRVSILLLLPDRTCTHTLKLADRTTALTLPLYSLRSSRVEVQLFLFTNGSGGFLSPTVAPEHIVSRQMQPIISMSCMLFCAPTALHRTMEAVRESHCAVFTANLLRVEPM